MITIGQVSGIIAATVVFIEYTIPAAIVVLLVRRIGNENTASTWSTVSRLAQLSIWPTLLQSDSVNVTGVRLSVNALSWVCTILLLLLAVAGVVTPLGLREAVVALDPSPAQFQYIQDHGPWGQSTPPRPDAEWSRTCSGVVLYANCPGTFGGIKTVVNTSGEFQTKDGKDSTFRSNIPKNLTTIFTSATNKPGETRSGVFDFQWRLYSSFTEKKVDNGKPMIRGEVQGVQRLLLNNKTELVEGLIVDTAEALGVGLRNHTAPVGAPLGATWSEEITWIEPVTECVDTNLTFQWKTDADIMEEVKETYLIDNGGLANLQIGSPLKGEYNDSQNPDLRRHAYIGAWASNLLTAIHLNVTTKGSAPRDSKVGAKYKIGGDSFGGPDVSKVYQMMLSSINGGYLDLGFSSSNGSGESITSSNFTDAADYCSGFVSGYQANITHNQISCGYLYSTPRLLNGREAPGGVFAPFTTYTRNLYVCASGVRAAIKQVSFLSNGTASTDSFHNVTVASVKDLKYSTKASKPLWAVENTGMKLRQITPLWGLISDTYEFASGLDSVRSEHLWLPAIAPGVGSLKTMKLGSPYSIAASLFSNALENAYIASESDMWLPDYAGKFDFALANLWKRLSATHVDAARIVNLIFTDLAAASAVGTKSSLSRAPTPGSMSAEEIKLGTPQGVLVTGYKKIITYDIRYAAPAILMLALWLVVVFFALVAVMFTGANVERLRQVINQTSAGRVATNLLYPDTCSPNASTGNWAKSAGLQYVKFRSIPSSGRNVDDVERSIVMEGLKGDVATEVRAIHTS